MSDCPKNGISITFDDGYLDTYEITAPYLIENNIPFTIFILQIMLKIKKWFYVRKMLKELSENNLVSIGSHSENHNQLTKLNDLDLFAIDLIIVNLI